MIPLLGRVIGVAVVLIPVGVGLFYQTNMNQLKQEKVTEGIRYVALGDSYTIGEGASQFESWPYLLARNLQGKGIPITLIANPSVTGWTTQEVIDSELPVYIASNPTFATLLIGVNDYVQGVPKEKFQKNLSYILDQMQLKLPDKSKIILVTIPDYTVTPRGGMYIGRGDGVKGLQEFNEIIKAEGKKRGLPVVDIFPLSQQMKNNPDLVAPDGLHPSAEEYALWEELIYPVAYKMLKK